MKDAPQPGLSLVAPAHNEAENLAPLVTRIRAALLDFHPVEIVLVDDGSVDDSWAIMGEIAAADSLVRPLRLDRRRGQSSALWAGISASRADVIATMDADLQQDPADLPAMLAALTEYDAVVGYRTRRADGWLKRVSSRLANAIRNRVTGDRVRDAGCSLRVMRRSAVLGLTPFDGMHRFLPTLLRQHGYTVLEHPVSHAPRQHGRSKYGLRNRALRGLVDLWGVRWLESRRIRD